MAGEQNIIEVRDLVKKFGNFVANDHLTFDVKRGEIFGFLGANGAGKTTAMKIMCGLSSPTSGDVKVAGYSVNDNPDAIKKRVGYMSQRFSLYEDLTVEENFRFYGGIYGMTGKKIREKSNILLGQLDLIPYRARLIRSLPLGWKQKIAFSVAIIHDPQIVFLDEPTAGVDPLARRQFWELIYGTAAGGITVFVTTHYMDEAEYCERISIMTEGKIVAIGTPADLKQKYDVTSIEAVFLRLARN
jgi:ABC-2 type transport system ATP-binding protein